MVGDVPYLCDELSFYTMQLILLTKVYQMIWMLSRGCTQYIYQTVCYITVPVACSAPRIQPGKVVVTL